MARKWSLLCLIVLIGILSIGCKADDERVDAKYDHLTHETYKIEMTQAIQSGDVQTFSELLTHYRETIKTNEDTLESEMGEVIAQEVQSMLVAGKGEEASQLVADLYHQTTQFISEMYYAYATEIPEVPEMRLGKDEMGKEFVVIYHYGSIYYSFDGLSYSLYEQGQKLATEGHERLFTYGQNGFDKKSDVLEVKLGTQEAFDTIIEAISYSEKYQFLSYYMEGMSRSRFYLEAIEAEETQDLPIEIDRLGSGYYGHFKNKDVTTYVLLVDEIDSPEHEAIAQKIMTYYWYNDLKTTMSNYGFKTCETFVVDDSQAVIDSIKRMSSDDAVITQIDPLKQSLKKLSRFYDQDEAYLILWGEDGGTLVLDEALGLVAQDETALIIQHYQERTYQ